MLTIMTHWSRCSAAAVLGAGSVAFAAELHVPSQFTTIQGAIDAATDLDEIVVDDGVYPEAIDFSGKALVVRSVNGAEATTIDAFLLNAPVVTMINVPESAVLQGFTIRGGAGLRDRFSNIGGGLYFMNSSPIVLECIVRDNFVDGVGAGAFVSGGAPTFLYTTFLRNHAITNIGVASQAGGLYVFNADVLVSHCRFLGNTSHKGGGILALMSQITVSNCIFSGNGITPTAGGGAMHLSYSSGVVTNSTIVNNNATTGRSLSGESSELMCSNSIIWSPQLNQIAHSDSNFSFAYCNIRASGGSGATWNSSIGTDRGGNIDVDPEFLDADGADNIAGTADDMLELAPSSPCIDAGSNAQLDADQLDLDGDADMSEPNPFDVYGRPRQVDDPLTPDTGKGAAPIVDLGALESQSGVILADFNGDGFVNGDDLAQLLSQWGTAGAADLNTDGVVDGADLAALLANWS